ncbi:MAG: hypothetical protein GEV10_05055 [Streptosporangiales bacterium]|nr:hypothetical protein [Streptosporangiales bacterium]
MDPGPCSATVCSCATSARAAGVRPCGRCRHPEPGLPEADRVFTGVRRLAESVADTVAAGAFPLVLAGDCNSCLGTVAGTGIHPVGVVWCDAHPDFDTVDDSDSGSLDSMGLRLLTGSGWRALRESIPGLRPVDERDVVLAAVRDITPVQQRALDASHVTLLRGGDFSDADLTASLTNLRARTGDAYLHIDLDSLDTRVGIANAYAAPGGLGLERLRRLVAEVFARFRVVAAALTAYDPAYDAEGAIARAGRTLAADIADHALATTRERHPHRPPAR